MFNRKNVFRSEENERQIQQIQQSTNRSHDSDFMMHVLKM